jgi:RNA polymerase sigma-70 factor (ECF subfamily)
MPGGSPWEESLTPSDVLEEPAAEPSERLAVARLRRGEPGAFEALVLAHQDRVFDFCLRMLADREEASDCVQEIFVSVHRNLDRFRMDSKLSTWIFRISHNHCLNRLKYLKRRGRGRDGGPGGRFLDADLAALTDPRRAFVALSSVVG